MKLSAILLAAGKGTRYNEIKQNVLFHDKPLWRYAYETTANVVGDENIIIVGKDVPGGETRAGSVLNGLVALPEDTDRVIIVEAARPMVTQHQIKQLVDDRHPAVSFVRPLVNSIVYRNGQSIDREELYDVLTPQAFDYKLLIKAYLSGKFNNATEETRVMHEFYGIKPYFIETGTNLFKVTYPGDLEIIESIYRQLKKEDL
ncbi:MAG: 2-C-methyl-D-erythritol 4-phosphate cytidylyltransferase [Lachnospiraceae bacterium]|nr:2-C-methyl-D-erythritol 4-phosphate cytidylyltransferase [Lachnospiraceae bacterium]